MAEHRLSWVYDPDRGAWDAYSGTKHVACVAKDGTGATPWGAYYKAIRGPDSWHRTRKNAIAECEQEARDDR